MNCEDAKDAKRKENNSLPFGWARTTLGDACEILMGQSPSSDTYNTNQVGLPFYQGKAEFGELHPTPVKWCSKPKKVAEAGDILISIRAPVGPTNICREKSCIGRGLAAIRAKDGMENFYFLYLLRHLEQDLAEHATGTTFAAISGNVLRDLEIPLAPLPEQHRIVAEIETRFTRLDAGIAALKRVQANLKRYKAAVLKAACEGKLVPQDSNDEPAEKLLERILAERRAKWEADLRAKGKDPKKAKYVEPTPPDTTDLPELPRGWVWTSIDQIISRLQYGTSVKADADSESGIPVLRMGNIQKGQLDFSDLKYIYPNKEDIPKYLLSPGDILINRTNSAELVGKAALFERQGNFVFASYLIRLRFDSNVVLARYVVSCINSEIGRQHVVKVKHQVAGQANINSQDIRTMPISLPPLAEQRRIVAEVERRLSVAQELEAAAATNLARAERLRQAILAQAFAGKLVPQDPNDEPASVLLERIRGKPTKTNGGRMGKYPES